MKKFLIIWLLIITLLSGCSTQASYSGVHEEPVSETVFAMDTVMQLTAYGAEAVVMDEAKKRILELEGLLSTTNTDSEVYGINQKKSGRVSPDTASLIQAGIKYGDITNGLLDVTVYPLVREWGFTTNNYRVPDKDSISRLLKNIDYKKIRFNKAEASVSLPDGMMMDFGSLAKGYAGDAVLKIFSDAGIKSAMVNLGGNVQTLGKKPDGSCWRVGIKNPEGENYIGTVLIDGRTVITSGGYERYFKDDNGKVYWHIFDPVTGYPAKAGLISVSVVTDTGIYGEALSTSLFIMGIKEASEFWRKHRDFEAVFISEKGSVYVTEGLRDNFSFSEDYSGHTLTVIEQ
ncbi:FAD:protein FMN transferase [Ruminiclostridium sufflavum]|uniref:FAD:protein FMN transferase n=1 Tax=Ruminiclostridium sufflavum TaxID=396504 RepID=UPI0014032E4E|nr:FAD:protein FMN transferase [Ruminiclostridium sufflavum]